MLETRLKEKKKKASLSCRNPKTSTLTFADSMHIVTSAEVLQ